MALFRNVEGGEARFHCPTSLFGQFLLASPGRMQICSALCVGSPWPPLLCDLFLLYTACRTTGAAGAGDQAALGLFQFIKMHCCCLDEEV